MNALTPILRSLATGPSRTPAIALLSLALVGLFALAPSGVAMAQPACDIPLIVQAGSVAPNVLIILDNSGSMNEVVYHTAYNDRIDWSGDFVGDKMYYVSTSKMYEPSDFKWGYAVSPSAPLIKSDYGNSGRYLGNYLNWVYFHATDEQRANLPQMTRMQAGRAAVNTVINEAKGLRYGLMVFDYDNGGKLKAELGTDEATLTAIVNGTAADSWTPSGETFVDAVEYFKTTGGGAPIQFECQQNFIVFVTDGFPTMDKNVPAWVGDQDGDGNEPGNCASIGAPYDENNDCRDYLDDVAYYLAHTDLRGDLDGDQFVYTYTIGFGITAPILDDAARNGLGFNLPAWDLNSLLSSLGTVIGDIINRISAGAAVAVVSTEQNDNGMLFRGKFMPGQWTGFFEAHGLPYNPQSPPLWESGQILKDRTPADRAIFTSLGGQMLEFNEGHAFDLEAALGVIGSEPAADIINYVRGEEVEGTRDRRGWKLGDLVYSTPVVVGKPSHFYLDGDYQQFLVNYENRETVVYIGANDGMMHAFRAADGEELWAYVPEGVLGTLGDLTETDYCHTTYVDLSPRAYDVRVNGAWRTVVIGGLRTGGDSYFCLDVTDPFDPELLWESSLPQTTTSFTEAAYINTRVAPLMWTGSGPDTGGAATLSILHMETGATLGWGTYDVIGETNMATAPVAYDSDFDGYADVVYQGDMAGILWRWDITDANPGTWFATVLYYGDQPIQGRPSLAMDPHGDILVYFGTGKYVETGDISTTNRQSFFCVRDPGDGTWYEKDDLLDQTDSIDEDPGANGWYFDLVMDAAERVIHPPVILDGVVYFTSFAPKSTACSAGGRSWLYHVDYLDGSQPDDEDGHEANNTDDRVEDLGDGVASRAVVNLGDNTLVVQTSDARLNIQDLWAEQEPLVVHAWQERFDGVSNEAVGDPQQQ